MFDEYIGQYKIESIEFENLSLGTLPPTIHGKFVIIFHGAFLFLSFEFWSWICEIFSGHLVIVFTKLKFKNCSLLLYRKGFVSLFSLLIFTDYEPSIWAGLWWTFISPLGVFWRKRNKKWSSDIYRIYYLFICPI